MGLFFFNIINYCSSSCKISAVSVAYLNLIILKEEKKKENSNCLAGKEEQEKRKCAE